MRPQYNDTFALTNITDQQLKIITMYIRLSGSELFKRKSLSYHFNRSVTTFVIVRAGCVPFVFLYIYSV